MNSTDLMFFAAVAETGGMGRAAARLNTVQSNVTGRIRALEQAMRGHCSIAAAAESR